MELDFALVGLLVSGPKSGYDLKKLLAQSESLHWSGNNNQVYAALVSLHRRGLAEREVHQPNEGPGKKVYAVTEAGREALREWLLGEVGLPQLRLPVLVHLLGAELLSDEELDGLLGRYEEDLRLKLAGMEELERRGRQPSFGDARQQLVWRAINDRPIAILRAEEDWVRQLRWAIANHRRKATQVHGRGTRAQAFRQEDQDRDD